MGARLTADALGQLRAEGKNRVIARLGRVVLAAPDINAQTFRAQVQAIGPLKPPLLVLVSKDDGALRVSSLLDGGIARAGAIDVDNPVVREAALKEKVQVVDISRLASRDDLRHDQFVSAAVLYSRLQHQAAPYRNTAGTFTFAEMTAVRSSGRSTLGSFRRLRNERARKGPGANSTDARLRVSNQCRGAPLEAVPAPILKSLSKTSANPNSPPHTLRLSGPTSPTSSAVAGASFVRIGTSEGLAPPPPDG